MQGYVAKDLIEILFLYDGPYVCLIISRKERQGDGSALLSILEYLQTIRVFTNRMEY